MRKEDTNGTGDCTGYRGHCNAWQAELRVPLLRHEKSGEASPCMFPFSTVRANTDNQLVTLPYNLLLQKNAREALGIDLTNQVIVIDEAHSQSSHLAVVPSTR